MATGYADYVTDATNAMNDIFLQSYKPSREDLRRVSNIACNTLRRIAAQTELLEDLRKLAYTQERFWAEYQVICESAHAFAIKFSRIEESALIEAGVEPTVAASLLEKVGALKEAIKDWRINPREVMRHLEELRDEACHIAGQLHYERINIFKRLRMRKRLRKITYAIGGIAIVGINASALAATVGLSAAGSAISGAAGSALVGAAAAIDENREPDSSLS